jgi:trans-aconitate 2-methyltransferase
MIEKASSIDGIRWEVGDLRTWARPDSLALRAPVDVLVANATLQWVPEHLELLPGLLGRVAPSGWLAFQVPGNFDEPSHTTRTELAAREPYAAHVRDARVPTSHGPDDYARLLLEVGCEVDAWETTYLHVLTGEDPVFRWVSGTGARPTLQALPDDLRPDFEDEFKALLREAYPADADGRVILPFRRIFVVAHKVA